MYQNIVNLLSLNMSHEEIKLKGYQKKSYYIFKQIL